MSPTKTQPDSARNSTTFPTKPPQGKRNIQIQRDALKEEIDKKTTFQRIHRKKGNLDQQNDIKSEVDFEQIQTQLEVVTLILAIINQLWLITTILRVNFKVNCLPSLSGCKTKTGGPNETNGYRKPTSQKS